MITGKILDLEPRVYTMGAAISWVLYRKKFWKL